jgi:hypothetical protein
MTAIYVIAAEGQTLCKIGVSNQPITRVDDLKSAYTTPQNAKLKLAFMRCCGPHRLAVERRALSVALLPKD